MPAPRIWKERLEFIRFVAFLTFAAAPVGIDRCVEGLSRDEHFWFVFWICLLAASGLVLFLSDRASRRALSHKVRTGVIRKLLALLADAFRALDPNVRTNIMIVNSDGTRRKVQSETAHNMSNDPDDGLEIDFGAGVSGQAARHRTATFGDLRYSPRPGHPDWGLTAAEQGRIRKSLQSIASVPILDPENPRGQILGTLQVDSDETMDRVFAEPEKVGYLASTVADVLALLIKDGG
jgi:hypothetical protein